MKSTSVVSVGWVCKEHTTKRTKYIYIRPDDPEKWFTGRKKHWHCVGFKDPDPDILEILTPENEKKSRRR